MEEGGREQSVAGEIRFLKKSAASQPAARYDSGIQFWIGKG